MTTLALGAAAQAGFAVAPDDTARALGSGALDVLATPRLLAWMEAVTCAVIDPSLDAARTSVGTRADLQHLAASAVGAAVEITATVVYLDGRLVRFDVVAHDRSGPDGERLIGQAELTRVVVDRDRFLARLPQP